MPCNSDYLKSNPLEVELSRVYLLLDEVKKGRHVDPESRAWHGYDGRAYCRGYKAQLDEAVRELCGLLQGKDVSRNSLELQIWWRDHQEADAKRQPNGEGI